ncbi:hypothetical protein [Paenibacillus sabinae]|uniref:hypothetical protein n=1 Tax=Paenibacillus sabinae TaxID=365617 RepID=UPI000AC1767D|nr:hypothetical protein [Paenibacillus sabinae]
MNVILRELTALMPGETRIIFVYGRAIAVKLADETDIKEVLQEWITKKKEK